MKMNFSTLSGIHVSLLLLLVATISAQDMTCASRKCSKSVYIYEFASGYRYSYAVNINQQVKNPNSGKVSKIEMTCLAEFQSVGTCDVLLTIKNVAFKERLESEEKTYKMMKNMIEKSPNLLFGFDNGLITDVCPIENDNPMVLNIKKAVVSQMQVAMKKIDVPEFTKETDISGECLTDYSLIDNRMEKKVYKISKVKSIAGCSDSYRYFSDFSGENDRRPTESRKLPFLDASHQCTIEIQQEDILLKSECEEIKTLQLFNSDVKGSEFKIKTNLKLLNKKMFEKPKSYDVKFRTKLTMDFGESKPLQAMKKLDKVPSLNSLLQELCKESTNDFVTVQLTKSFMDIQDAVLEETEANIKKAWSSLDTMKCGNIQKVKQITLEAFANSKCTHAHKIVISETSSSQLPGMSLGMIQNPNIDLISKVSADIKSDEYVILLSSMIQSFCRLNPGCIKNMKIQLSISKIMSRIGNDCSGKSIKVLYGLKAIENMGMSLNNAVYAGILTKCLENPKASLDTKIAAIESVKNFDCSKDILTVLSKVLRNVDKSSEERIQAYLGLMQCPEIDNIRLIVTFLRQCRSQQLGSFIWSHLNNLANSKSFSKSSISNVVGKVSSELKQLEQKFNLDFRHYSKNFEKTFTSGSTSLNLDGSLLFTPNSPYPTSALMNVTVDLYGRSVNLFDISVRGNPLASLLDKTSSISNQKFTNTFKSFDDQVPKIPARNNVIMTSKLMGRRYGFYPDFSTALASPVMKIMYGGKIEYGGSLLVQDTTVSLATMGGLPLNVEMKIGAMSKLVFTNPKKSLDVQVNAALRAVGIMEINGHCTKIGVKTESEISIDKSVKANYESKIEDDKKLNNKNFLDKFTIQPIPSNKKLFFIKNVLSGINNFESENSSPNFKMFVNQCSSKALQILLGVKMCWTIQTAKTYKTFYPNIIGELKMDEFNGIELISTQTFQLNTYYAGVSKPKLIDIRFREITGKAEIVKLYSDKKTGAFELSVLRKYIYINFNMNDDVIKGEFKLGKKTGTIDGKYNRAKFTVINTNITIKAEKNAYSVKSWVYVRKEGPRFEIFLDKLDENSQTIFNSKLKYSVTKVKHAIYKEMLKYNLAFEYDDESKNLIRFKWFLDRNIRPLISCKTSLFYLRKENEEVKHKYDVSGKYYRNDEYKINRKTNIISHQFTLNPDLKIGSKTYKMKYDLFLVASKMLLTRNSAKMIKINFKKTQGSKIPIEYLASVDYDFQYPASKGILYITHKVVHSNWSIRSIADFKLNWIKKTFDTSDTYDVMSSISYNKAYSFDLKHTNKDNQMKTNLEIYSKNLTFLASSKYTVSKKHELKISIDKSGNKTTWLLTTIVKSMSLKPININVVHTLAKDGKLTHKMMNLFSVKMKENKSTIKFKSELKRGSKQIYSIGSNIKFNLYMKVRPSNFVKTVIRNLPTGKMSGDFRLKIPPTETDYKSNLLIILNQNTTKFEMVVRNQTMHFKTIFRYGKLFNIHFQTNMAGKTELFKCTRESNGNILINIYCPKTCSMEYKFIVKMKVKNSTIKSLESIENFKLYKKDSTYSYRNKMKYKADEYIKLDVLAKTNMTSLKFMTRIPMNIKKNKIILEMKFKPYQNFTKFLSVNLKYNVMKKRIKIDGVTKFQFKDGIKEKIKLKVDLSNKDRLLKGEMKINTGKNNDVLLNIKTKCKYNANEYPLFYKLKVIFQGIQLINLNIDDIVMQLEKDFNLGMKMSIDINAFDNFKMKVMEKFKITKLNSFYILNVKGNYKTFKSLSIDYKRNWSKYFKGESTVNYNGKNVLTSFYEMTEDFSSLKSSIDYKSIILKLNYKNESNAFKSDFLFKNDLLKLKVSEFKWDKESKNLLLVTDGEYGKSPFNGKLTMNFQEKFIANLKADWKKKTVENWKIDLQKQDIYVSTIIYDLITGKGKVKALLKYNIKSLEDFTIMSSLLIKTINVWTFNILYLKKDTIDAELDFKFKKNIFFVKTNINSERTKLISRVTLVLKSQDISLKNLEIELTGTDSIYKGVVKNKPNYYIVYEMKGAYRHKLVVEKKQANILTTVIQIYDPDTNDYYVIVKYKDKQIIDFKGKALIDKSLKDLENFGDLFNGKINYNISLDGNGLVLGKRYELFINQFFGVSSKLNGGKKTGYTFKFINDTENSRISYDLTSKFHYAFPYFNYKHEGIYTKVGGYVRNKVVAKYQGMEDLYFEVLNYLVYNEGLYFLLFRDKQFTQIFGRYDREKSIGMRYKRDNPNRNIQLHLQYEFNNNHTLSTNIPSIYDQQMPRYIYYLNYRNKDSRFDLNIDTEFSDKISKGKFNMTIKTPFSKFRSGKFLLTTNNMPPGTYNLYGDVDISINGKNIVNEPYTFYYNNYTDWSLNVTNRFIAQIIVPQSTYHFYWDMLSSKVVVSGKNTYAMSKVSRNYWFELLYKKRHMKAVYERSQDDNNLMNIYLGWDIRSDMVIGYKQFSNPVGTTELLTPLINLRLVTVRKGKYSFEIIRPSSKPTKLKIDIEFKDGKYILTSKYFRKEIIVYLTPNDQFDIKNVYVHIDGVLKAKILMKTEDLKKLSFDFTLISNKEELNYKFYSEYKYPVYKLGLKIKENKQKTRGLALKYKHKEMFLLHNYGDTKILLSRTPTRLGFKSNFLYKITNSGPYLEMRSEYRKKPMKYVAQILLTQPEKTAQKLIISLKTSRNSKMFKMYRSDAINPIINDAEISSKTENNVQKNTLYFNKKFFKPMRVYCQELLNGNRYKEIWDSMKNKIKTRIEAYKVVSEIKLNLLTVVDTAKFVEMYRLLSADVYGFSNKLFNSYGDDDVPQINGLMNTFRYRWEWFSEYLTNATNNDELKDISKEMTKDMTVNKAYEIMVYMLEKMKLRTETLRANLQNIRDSLKSKNESYKPPYIISTIYKNILILYDTIQEYKFVKNLKKYEMVQTVISKIEESYTNIEGLVKLMTEMRAKLNEYMPKNTYFAEMRNTMNFMLARKFDKAFDNIFKPDLIKMDYDMSSGTMESQYYISPIFKTALKSMKYAFSWAPSMDFFTQQQDKLYNLYVSYLLKYEYLILSMDYKETIKNYFLSSSKTAYILNGKYFMTFDGQSTVIGDGKCSSLLVRDFKSKSFAIVMNRQSKNSVSYTIYYTTKVTLKISENVEIFDDDKKVEILPKRISKPKLGFIDIIRTTLTYEIKLDNGVSLIYIPDVDEIQIKLPGSLHGRVMGMLGSNDYEAANDRALPNRIVTGDMGKLIDSWKFGECSSGTKTGLYRTRTDPTKLKMCYIWNHTNLKFCKTKIDVKPYLDICTTALQYKDFSKEELFKFVCQLERHFATRCSENKFVVKTRPACNLCTNPKKSKKKINKSVKLRYIKVLLELTPCSDTYTQIVSNFVSSFYDEKKVKSYFSFITLSDVNGIQRNNLMSVNGNYLLSKSEAQKVLKDFRNFKGKVNYEERFKETSTVIQGIDMAMELPGVSGYISTIAAFPCGRCVAKKINYSSLSYKMKNRMQLVYFNNQFGKGSLSFGYSKGNDYFRPPKNPGKKIKMPKHMKPKDICSALAVVTEGSVWNMKNLYTEKHAKFGGFGAANSVLNYETDYSNVCKCESNRYQYSKVTCKY